MRKHTWTKKYAEQMAAEYFHIQFFLVEHLRKRPGRKILIKEIFEAYQIWRKKQDKKPTLCSVDTFGKYFPKQYPRKYMRHNGDSGRGLEGYTLVYYEDGIQTLGAPGKSS